MKRVQGFLSEDGRIFASEEACLSHEAELQVQQFCREHFSGGNYSHQMIAEVLVHNATKLSHLLRSLSYNEIL